MILVAGESLIVDPAGGVRASLGGGPYNAARTMARLGAEVQFLGRVSADPFGSRLAEGLAQSGVRLGQPAPVAEPSTLAVLSVGYKADDLPPQSPRIKELRRDTAEVVHRGQWGQHGNR